MSGRVYYFDETSIGLSPEVSYAWQKVGETVNGEQMTFTCSLLLLILRSLILLNVYGKSLNIDAWTSRIMFIIKNAS